MDRNGYNPSIFGKNTDERCFLCGRWGDTARHEIYFGPNRQISKKAGFWINVCPSCHTRIHAEATTPCDVTIDRLLKIDCQEVFEREHTREEFMELIGRSYK